MQMIHTATVPFQTTGNRQYLTAEQVMDDPDLWKFINLFSRCFEYELSRDVWIFYPDGDAPGEAAR